MGDFALANTYFEHAIRSDNTRTPDTFQAYYYLAELAARASTDSCPTAVSFYKRVAERGDWDHEVWWEAERARERGDLRTALLGYWMMAERGYEVAQNNVAWILDSSASSLRRSAHPMLMNVNLMMHRQAKPPTADLRYCCASPFRRRETARPPRLDVLDALGGSRQRRRARQDGRLLLQRTRDRGRLAAARKGGGVLSERSDDALLGHGHVEPRLDARGREGGPSGVYLRPQPREACDRKNSLDRTQDFHLAKRNYDMALETSGDAFFPSSLALVGLYGRALWHAVTKSGDDELKALSLFGRDPDLDGIGAGFAEHGLWNFGRAWRDIQRSWGVDPGPDPEVLPAHGAEQAEGAPADGAAQGAAHRERADVRAAQRALEGAEDPMEWEGYRGRGRGGEGDEEEMEDDGDFGGTVAIVALSMLLA